ncbi:hypothetical protein [Hymenobacter armeniacus]|uniref:CAAX protease n=1 Tax=Hymenobacter armeniacus TaxID=2771358 RepID=A0ABR8JU42_9BACT|nr:hypothetical protein [Hymenobacter armeniacus]MBD2722125.1 hypothetical protein [Hymenobacter armeniacus]
MTAQEIEQYFQYHNSNAKLIGIGLEQLKYQIKKHYLVKNKSGDYIYLLDDSNPEKIKTRQVEKVLSRMYSGIQVSWAEESIKRLLYERNLLTDIQRTYLIRKSALDQRWHAALKLVFCIAYEIVPTTDETCQSVDVNDERGNLGDELVDQYFELRGLISNYLSPNFSIRNKVQHGEWEFAFKAPHSEEFSLDITNKINRENIITTTSRYNLVNAFYQLLVDLGRFKSNAFALDSMMTPFEYFYPKYMRKIKGEILKINNPNLNTYIVEMLGKAARGDVHKLSQT